MQRASVDLDFNSRMGNPNSIIDLIDEINKISRKDGRIAVVRNIAFGSIRFGYLDEESGTLTFMRRMPSRFSDYVKVGEDTIQGVDQRIQINYKNSWLPALLPIEKEPDFLILDHEQPAERTRVLHSSREDLVTDKILATCSVHGFGRERFKDVYDLGILLMIEMDEMKIRKKLNMISNRINADPEDFLKGTTRTLSSLSGTSMKARGFSAMVGKGGRKVVFDWEMFCLRTIERIKAIMLNP